MRVLISDFGESVLAGRAYRRTGHTGTLLYAAPELLTAPSDNYGACTDSSGSENSICDAAGPAVDLWSLGVVLELR